MKMECKFCAIRKDRYAVPVPRKENKMNRLDVFAQPVFAVINNVFYLPYRKIEFFRKALKSDSVQ